MANNPRPAEFRSHKVGQKYQILMSKRGQGARLVGGVQSLTGAWHSNADKHFFSKKQIARIVDLVADVEIHQTPVVLRNAFRPLRLKDWARGLNSGKVEDRFTKAVMTCIRLAFAAGYTPLPLSPNSELPFVEEYVGVEHHSRAYLSSAFRLNDKPGTSFAHLPIGSEVDARECMAKNIPQCPSLIAFICISGKGSEKNIGPNLYPLQKILARLDDLDPVTTQELQVPQFQTRAITMPHNNKNNGFGSSSDHPVFYQNDSDPIAFKFDFERTRHRLDSQDALTTLRQIFNELSVTPTVIPMAPGSLLFVNNYSAALSWPCRPSTPFNGRLNAEDGRKILVIGFRKRIGPGQA